MQYRIIDRPVSEVLPRPGQFFTYLDRGLLLCIEKINAGVIRYFDFDINEIRRIHKSMLPYIKLLKPTNPPTFSETDEIIV